MRQLVGGITSTSSGSADSFQHGETDAEGEGAEQNNGSRFGSGDGRDDDEINGYGAVTGIGAARDAGVAKGGPSGFP